MARLVNRAHNNYYADAMPQAACDSHSCMKRVPTIITVNWGTVPRRLLHAAQSSAQLALLHMANERRINLSRLPIASSRSVVTRPHASQPTHDRISSSVNASRDHVGKVFMADCKLPRIHSSIDGQLRRWSSRHKKLNEGARPTKQAPLFRKHVQTDL